MFKRTIAVITIFMAMLCLTVKVDAADAPRHTKDDTWLIYWYICGADDLEGRDHFATRDIAEMQNVKLPSNINVLIYAGGTTSWHHPTISGNGDGMYLYSANGLVKLTDSNAEDMSNPSTLEKFLQYGEDNFVANHKIIIFWDHGGVNGICYDDKWATRDEEGNIVSKSNLSYDALKEAFTAVYGNAPENPPFELVGFDACVTGAYELANSIADFSRYMTGSEPSSFGWHYTPWLAALANDPSMNGAQIGKAICDSTMKSYDAVTKRTNAISVIDLTKMPELRTAYEAYFNESFARSNEELGFSATFARAAENRNMDKYSNCYTDLGLLAKNTKAIMPDTSANLLKAIDKAVVYNKRGAYLKGKGISTYYPYTSTENPQDSGLSYFKLISEQNSNYSAQKIFYSELLKLNVSDLQSGVSVERKDGHLVAQLTPEQLENFSSIQCVLFPVNEDGNYKLGGAILASADDLKIDWKNGTVTEKFRAMEPIFDGHRILMYPTSSGRGHTFYTVPILYNYEPRDLIVRYDTSTKKYEIVGFGTMIENGMVRVDDDEQPSPGAVITPTYYTIDDNNDTENVVVISNNPETSETEYDMKEYIDPQTGVKFFIKKVMGESFVFTRDSTIMNKKINRGNYCYLFTFNTPNGENISSDPGFIVVKDGKITKLTSDEFKDIIAANAAK